MTSPCVGVDVMNSFFGLLGLRPKNIWWRGSCWTNYLIIMSWIYISCMRRVRGAKTRRKFLTRQEVQVHLSMSCALSCDYWFIRYVGMMQKNQSMDTAFDPASILDPLSFRKRSPDGAMQKFAIDRRNLYKKSKETAPDKIPKELASIIEQTLIPVYMDGASRPPRKCRIISS